MWLKSLAFIIGLFAMSTHAAVVLQYHHVSDTTPESTSLTVQQFQQHMDYLKENNFKVLPLSKIINDLRSGKKLAEKTVAITFDDGYANVLINADPILKQLQFPYTVFVAPKEISANHLNMLTWAQLKAMTDSGVEIANHSWEHLHLNRQLTDETVEQWQARIKQDIESAEAEIIKHTGHNFKYLAYPYGEYNSELQQLITSMGFVGIGQHSGALAATSDFSALPRFPASGRYANLKTLKVKLKSLAMPVTKLVNANPQLDQHSDSELAKRPQLTVTVKTKDLYKPTLNCYILGGAVAPQWINENTFTITSETDLPAGRSRYNCTAQSRTQSGYYWFSQPWINRNADGSWYEN
ncbi:polysaccharide deacetylase family protein [Psychrobium sp. 1_MG-2023]|uniref:polysaccharide deacetylase family protein n=1 Tax=Psychrobium sp. 1_MG-2023 TaxID=3062624 RepID=UPI000C33570C|nr:polysaccharide deacetylase family protein [Psychrobium sp. 1_MG-2023]MDP2559565.1 polysaccharide deacetylase family protein [Psychrobium sp. 1_MG-2023]PKF59404.1 polysaccharide deacetylase [Alteromonadales bacterium alter-6D02]